jgi:glycosyltransferase involved in cell wall biosynthesis
MIGPREGEFLVGFCGSFKPWHDLETLVLAMERLRAAVPARLVLSGDGPARNSLLALTHRHRVPALFSGAVGKEEARALMTCCDVIAIPYARSGTDFSPLKLVEAMTTGRPIVATETSSTRRVLGEGKTGLLVTAGDAAAMAQALEKLATQPALREQLSAAARGRAVEHYSWDVAAERLLTFATACRSRAEHCA